MKGVAVIDSLATDVRGDGFGCIHTHQFKGHFRYKKQLTGYTIVEAASHEAAAKLFLNHPHFSIFPGDSIEIMECLPIPER